MSEKGIQNKQISPWPWIAGIITLAGFIWFLLIYVYLPENYDNKVLPGDISYTGHALKVPVDTVNEVRDFISYTKDTDMKFLSIGYSEKGLIKLQSAISYISDRVDSTDSFVGENLDSLDYAVVKIDTSSNNYLGELKPAFLDAIDAIEAIQKINYPGLGDHIKNLRNTANSIDIKRSVHSQMQKIRNFYKQAADMLYRIRF